MSMDDMETTNERTMVSARRLGRLPAKSTRQALMFSDFFKYVSLPTSQTYWRTHAAIPLRNYGNLEYGDCTRAKQAVSATRMERLEQKRTINIPDSEVIRVYVEMSNRLYGGGDNGAYEDDALNEWRNPETTFRDVDGHPYTIDAYLRINAFNHDEVRAALALASAKGIAICLNLPAAFSRITPPGVWDVPKGQPLTGMWMAGSWGGHSMNANGFTKEGIWIDHTWDMPMQLLTWDAAAAYMDEAHLIIDSLNSWKKQVKDQGAVKFALADVRDAVNAMSAIQI
jgi:hypothetical protein